ncbi:DUF3299 domain-containing protein [Paraferrimonas sedimenticola]|uniref:DUF3299 domain-containing protein n=1 Tax=Paraferrimonas sedimenticola TaxID=375674 RepID=A0AA37VVV4_9GAMM|nr:DUF3299 domain-containing protein [Paraferrimonas sedimenticola]GLP96279.1 hypothetical protein GCM10007895_15850 [Paraferrimonas sedimenticola]
MKSLFRLFVTLCLVISSSLASAAPVKLHWHQLIPEEHREDTLALIKSTMNPYIHKDGVVAPQRVNDTLKTTVDTFNGQQIAIRGYMVPLDADERGIFTLMLAPFAGACIHVPPPPPNQLIYIELAEGEILPWEAYSSPIEIRGVIQTEQIDGEMAMTSYTIKGADFSLL